MHILSEVLLFLSSIFVTPGSSPGLPLSSSTRFSVTPPAVTIPFERVNKNICLQVSVANSKPLSFILDTGAEYALIDLAVAKSLGLELGDQVAVGGAGKNVVTGNFLKNSSFRVVGLENFSQPLSLAIPLDGLAKASGHEFAGILGYDFISQFVVEVDYLKQTITLRDKEGYQYQGPGESFRFPLTLQPTLSCMRESLIMGTLPSREPLYWTSAPAHPSSSTSHSSSNNNSCEPVVRPWLGSRVVGWEASHRGRWAESRRSNSAAIESRTL